MKPINAFHAHSHVQNILWSGMGLRQPKATRWKVHHSWSKSWRLENLSTKLPLKIAVRLNAQLTPIDWRCTWFPCHRAWWNKHLCCDHRISIQTSPISASEIGYSMNGMPPILKWPLISLAAILYSPGISLLFRCQLASDSSSPQYARGLYAGKLAATERNKILNISTSMIKFRKDKSWWNITHDDELYAWRLNRVTVRVLASFFIVAI
jgi:hypothetical protein